MKYWAFFLARRDPETSSVSCVPLSFLSFPDRSFGSLMRHLHDNDGVKHHPAVNEESGACQRSRRFNYAVLCTVSDQSFSSAFDQVTWVYIDHGRTSGCSYLHLSLVSALYVSVTTSTNQRRRAYYTSSNTRYPPWMSTYQARTQSQQYP